VLKHFKHQAEAISKFRTIPRGLDYSDAGTGKTRVMIDLFAERRKAGGGRALIIAPKTLLEPAWGEDFKKFAPDMELSIAYAVKRAESFAKTADVYITNTDATRWLAKQRPSFFRPFDTLIIDEISGFKHRTSLRSRCLRKIIKHFRYRYGLTGTPNANHILDVWNQVFVIDDGSRLGKSFAGYRNSVAYPVQVGPQPNMIKWEEKPGAPEAITDLLSDITIRYVLEECHDMPKNHVYRVSYSLPPQQRAAYDEMEKFALLQLKDGVVNAVNAASLVTKLLQIASGSVYDEQGSPLSVENGRYQLIADLAKAREHSIVFFNWKHQAAALQGYFQKEGITYCLLDGTVKAHERANAVREFQKGYYRVCLAQPQSTAHGLTLTKGTTTIWSSPTYNLELFIQGNHRIYRAGQEKRTETLLITAPGTIETKVYQKLQAKDDKQVDFLNLIKTLSK